MQITRAKISIVVKKNKLKVHTFVTINFCIRNKNTRTLTATITINNHFVNLISLSGQSHILSSAESIARGKISYPSGNTTSLYLEETFYSFNFSLNLLINDLSQLFINLNSCLCQSSRDSWYVTACIYIL